MVAFVRAAHRRTDDRVLGRLAETVVDPVAVLVAAQRSRGEGMAIDVDALRFEGRHRVLRQLLKAVVAQRAGGIVEVDRVPHTIERRLGAAFVAEGALLLGDAIGWPVADLGVALFAGEGGGGFEIVRLVGVDATDADAFETASAHIRCVEQVLGICFVHGVV